LTNYYTHANPIELRCDTQNKDATTTLAYEAG